MKKFFARTLLVLAIVLTTFVATIAGEVYLLIADIKAASQTNDHDVKIVRQWTA